MSRYHAAVGMRPDILYHGIGAGGEISVLENGLRPYESERLRNFGQSEADSVYLSPTEEGAARWAYISLDEGRGGPDESVTVVFAVDVSMLDPSLLMTDPNSDGDWRYRGAVPPAAVSVAARRDWSAELAGSDRGWSDGDGECPGCGRGLEDCRCDAVGEFDYSA